MAVNFSDPKRMKYCCFCKSWVSKEGNPIISLERIGIKFDTQVHGYCLKNNSQPNSGAFLGCKDWSPNVDVQRYL